MATKSIFSSVSRDMGWWQRSLLAARRAGTTDCASSEIKIAFGTYTYLYVYAETLN